MRSVSRERRGEKEAGGATEGGGLAVKCAACLSGASYAGCVVLGPGFVYRQSLLAAVVCAQWETDGMTVLQSLPPQNITPMCICESVL